MNIGAQLTLHSVTVQFIDIINSRNTNLPQDGEKSMASRGINKVILVGNLGNDPDVRFSANGSAVATLSIATSDGWTDRNTGQPVEKTEWHRVVIFGKLAEIAQQYLRKGSKVYIEGKLQTRKWQGQDGQDRYTTEIVVDGFNGQMQMLDSRSDNVQTSGYGQANQAPQPSNAYPNNGQQQYNAHSQQQYGQGNAPQATPPNYQSQPTAQSSYPSQQNTQQSYQHPQSAPQQPVAAPTQPKKPAESHSDIPFDDDILSKPHLRTS